MIKSSALLPLYLLALRTLLGYAYILVRGHSLSVLHWMLAPFGYTKLGFVRASG